MVTIRKRIYSSNNNENDTFNRLRLDVEEVNTFFENSILSSDVTVDTNKRWVGKIDPSERMFEMIKPNNSLLPFRFLEGNFYNIYVNGRVVKEDSKTRIEVDFKIGYFAILWLLAIYLMPITGILKSIMLDDKINEIFPFIMIFTIPGTLLLIYQLKNTEEETMNSLGVRREKNFFNN